MRPRTRNPRGASLGELLAVLTGLGVAMAVATGLVHTGMRQQSISRLELERDRTAMRLARDFREDVRQAASVRLANAAEDAELEAADDGTRSLVQLTLTDGRRIDYRTTRQGVTRLRGGDERRVHEDYVFGVPMDWDATRDNGCLVLSGVTPEQSDRPHMPRASAPLDVRVVAAITGEAQDAGSAAEETP